MFMRDYTNKSILILTRYSLSFNAVFGKVLTFSIVSGGRETGAALTNLSKAFEYIDDNLLIAKLDVYGFEKQSINFLHSYLTKRKQRSKVDSACSSWEMLLSVVPQGSILGPLLFNIYIWDMFFKTPKILISMGLQTTIFLTHALQI